MTEPEYIVVGDGNDWHVEEYDSTKAYHHESPFSERWLEQGIAQKVADVANALDADTLQKFIDVIDA